MPPAPLRLVFILAEKIRGYFIHFNFFFSFFPHLTSKEQPQPCPVPGRAGARLLFGILLVRGVRRAAEFLNWGRGTSGASGQERGAG